MTVRPQSGGPGGVPASRRLEAAVLLCGCFASLVGLTALVGWFTASPELQSIFAGSITIKTNTALGLVLLGLSLILQRRPPGRGAHAAGVLLAGLAGLIGLATLIQHLFGWNLGIDQLLFREAPGLPATTSPNRMGIPASLCFPLLGAALILLGRERPARMIPSQWLALAVMLIALVPFLGYVFHVQALFGIARFTGIALHTAMSFLLLGIGVFMARPELGLMRRIMADDSSGLLLRRMLPAAIVVPIVLGWLRVAGQDAGLYDTEFGRTLLVLMFILAFTALVWWMGTVLARHEPPAHASARPIDDVDHALVRTRLQDLAAVGVALTVMVLVVGAIAGTLNARRLIENDRRVAQTHALIAQSSDLLSTLKDAETGQRGYLLTGDESYLEPYEDALQREYQAYTQLRDLTTDNPAQQARVAALGPLITRKIEQLRRTVQLAREGDRASALRMVQAEGGQSTMDSLRTAVADIQGDERALLRRRDQESAASSRATAIAILLPALIGIVLVSMIFVSSQRTHRLRQRTAELIARERNQLQVTLASIGDAVVTADTSGRVTSLNPVAELLTGWSDAEAAGRPLETVVRIRSGRNRRAERPGAHALERGGIVRLGEQAMLTARDGREYPIDDSASPIRDTDGRPLGVVLVFRDVSERRHAEQALHESRTRLESELADTQLLQAISTELIHEPDPGALYERLVDAALQIMRSDFASMQRFDPEPHPDGSLRLLAHRGFTPRSAEFWSTVGTASDGSCGTVLRTHDRVLVPDLDRESGIVGTPDHEMYVENGIRSVQSTPLISRSGAFVGVISTHWREPHQPDPRRLLLFDILAREAADLIERKQNEVDIRAARDALATTAARDAFRVRLVDALRGLADPLEIELTACRILGEHLGTERANFAEVDAAGEDFVLATDYFAPGLQSMAGRYPVRLFSAAFSAAPAPGRASAVSDVATDPTRTDAERVAYAALQVRSFVAVALVRGGRLSAGFAVHQSTPRVWTEDEKSLVEETAERAWAAVERARAVQGLKDADRRKDEFLAILAHELRNPLAPVRNAAHVLKLQHFIDPGVRRPIEMIDRQVAQMARLIDDLLDVSRITRGVVALQLEPVEFQEIAQAVIDAHQGEIESRGHRLHVELPEGSTVLKADRQRLVQAFGNLIANAARYTPAGGRITFTARREGPQLEVRVVDNGIGIAPAHLSEIFEMFAQVDRSLERQGGLGIGLTLARQLIELHHGTIEARSEGLGSGSTFIVRLPLASPAPAEPLSANGEDHRAEARHILVVDDSRDAAESLALVLEMAGHDVRVATDGRQALDQAARRVPEVAFIDIGMPGMNGYDLARAIRGEPWGRAIRLVALTGWGQESDRRRSREAGFDVHLVKPVSPDAVRAILQNLEPSPDAARDVVP